MRKESTNYFPSQMRSADSIKLKTDVGADYLLPINFIWVA